MKRVLALTDSPVNVRSFCEEHELLLFKVGQLPPQRHGFEVFENVFDKLRASCDLESIDLVIGEYIESLPLIHLMRRHGHHCPALLIPHTNPYPLNILTYFLLLAADPHPGDRIVCGSQNAASAYTAITGIQARAICTFGIRDIYRPGEQVAARQRLGLHPDRKILLYTGRFMNDKGLAPLLDGYHGLRAELGHDVQLVMSVTHVDNRYYNRLAHRLEDVVMFQRLERDETVDLYNAADVFVSGATSVFETYGKSPLEAMACGVPAVVPRWDGFQYFVNDSNGALVSVDRLQNAHSNPFEFARMNTDDFILKCRSLLTEGTSGEVRAPDWATYAATMESLRTLVAEMLRHPAESGPPIPDMEIQADAWPDPVRDVLDFYEISTLSELAGKTQRAGLIDQSNVGDSNLLRSLHEEIFTVMDETAALPQTPAQL